MACTPSISNFYPLSDDYYSDQTVPTSSQFRIAVTNAGDPGTIYVDFDSQPALTSGSAATWKFVRQVSFSNVGSNVDPVVDDPTLTLPLGDAQLRAVCRGVPGGAPGVTPVATINVVVV